MTIFGDKIRKLMDDIQSRVVYIKNWQLLYLSVEL